MQPMSHALHRHLRYHDLRHLVAPLGYVHCTSVQTPLGSTIDYGEAAAPDPAHAGRRQETPELAVKYLSHARRRAET